MGKVEIDSIRIEEPICSFSIASLTGTSQMINPSSGGSLSISGSITESSGQPVTWILTTPDGKTTTGSGTSVSATWDGKDAGGKVVKPGSYSATLTAQTADGQCTDTKTLPITVTEAEDGQCGLYVQFGSSAHMASGNLSHSQSLFSARGGSLPAELTLYYNSLDPANGSLGRGWSHNYDVSLKENSDGSVLISEGNWRHKSYTFSGGTYSGQPGNTSTLVKNTDGTFRLTSKDGQTSIFNTSGKLASITDRNGNTATFAYSNNNLNSLTDPSGRTVIFSYDGSNHLTSVTDPSGNNYNFSVGTDLTSVVQPDGGTWQYGYDSNGFMLNKTDPRGNTTTYAYDEQHRVSTSTDPEGKTRGVAYPQTSETVKSTTFTEKDGGVWSYSYDTQKGLLLSKTDPQSGTTSYSYDSYGNRTAVTAPDGTSTSYTFDAGNNMTSMTDAQGQTTSYTYNTFGQVTSITDPQGGKTVYAYDAKGNMTSLTDPAGAITQYAYGAKGNVIQVTNPLGLSTGFTYDNSGNIAAVTDSSGATTTYAYDAAGNVVSITDPKGAITRLVYDSRNRLIKTIDPQGNTTTSAYDLNGNKTSDTDANGNITKYEYNSQNQLIKTTNALGYVTTYSYGGSGCSSCGGGGNGKLTSVTDANNNVTGYEYNQLGKLARETDPLGDVTSYSYDPKGNLVSRTDANGNVITYSYDVNNRLLRKAYPDNTEETFTYDAKGNTLTAANKDISYSFTYDANGRMLTSTGSNGKTITYAYDIAGNKTSVAYPDGSAITYAYDNANHLNAITSPEGKFTFGYDTLGRRTLLTYPNGATASYSYDKSGRLTKLEHRDRHGRKIDSYAYTLDKVGNRLTKTDLEKKTTYVYDDIYQLIKAEPNRHREHKPEAYSYDPAGNRLTGPRPHTSYTYGTGNQLLSTAGAVYNYDKNGNLTEKSAKQHHHGEQEHQHSKHKWSYTYDFENRLIKAETRRGHETTTVTFKYDPFGRRIEKKVTESEHRHDQADTTSYIYDGQAIILEEKSGKQEHHNHHGKHHKITRYIHGPNIDEPLAMTRKDDSYFYHADGLGSIVALTDRHGRVVQRYEYDSFGDMKQKDNEIGQPFTYTGREWDKETGLYFYRARYYDPMVGRFISRDPISFKGGDVNLYAYVQNNPVNLKDPSGLSPSCCGKWEGRAFRNFAWSCRCHWLCKSSQGEIWSGNWTSGLPTTSGTVINVGTGHESGDACMCKDPDGGGHIIDLPNI